MKLTIKHEDWTDAQLLEWAAKSGAQFSRYRGASENLSSEGRACRVILADGRRGYSDSGWTYQANKVLAIRAALSTLVS